MPLLQTPPSQQQTTFSDRLPHNLHLHHSRRKQRQSLLLPSSVFRRRTQPHNLLHQVQPSSEGRQLPPQTLRLIRRRRRAVCLDRPVALPPVAACLASRLEQRRGQPCLVVLAQRRPNLLRRRPARPLLCSEANPPSSQPRPLVHQELLPPPRPVFSAAHLLPLRALLLLLQSRLFSAPQQRRQTLLQPPAPLHRPQLRRSPCSEALHQHRLLLRRTVVALCSEERPRRLSRLRLPLPYRQQQRPGRLPLWLLHQACLEAGLPPLLRLRLARRRPRVVRLLPRPGTCLPRRRDRPRSCPV